jgi:NAD(P)-dependent dehydrogenase (short-subunit alcohol dehydrogenase family)
MAEILLGWFAVMKEDQMSSQVKTKPRTPTNPAQPEPMPPFPEQHQQKPGIESRLDPRPRFQAEEYRAAGKLKGKVALITGGDSGIGRAVAVLFAREGADVAIGHLAAERGDADETRRAIESHGQKCLLLEGDVLRCRFLRRNRRAHGPAVGQTRHPRVERRASMPRMPARRPKKLPGFGCDVPMGRPAQPEELAPAYVFLASNADSSYVTGTVLQVMGGETTGG